MRKLNHIFLADFPFFQGHNWRHTLAPSFAELMKLFQSVIYNVGRLSLETASKDKPKTKNWSRASN